MLVPSRRLLITGIGASVAAPALINHAMKLRGTPMDPWVVAFDIYEGMDDYHKENEFDGFTRSQFDPFVNSFNSHIHPSDVKSFTAMKAPQRVAYLNRVTRIRNNGITYDPHSITYKLLRESDLKNRKIIRQSYTS
jgi:hypothetical protein